MGKSYAYGYKSPMGSGLASVKGVEVFSTGFWQGDTYSHRDLHDIVNNFRLFSSGGSPVIPIPMGIGHESEQKLLENTGLPRLGGIQDLSYSEVPCRECSLRGGQAKSGVCRTCFGTGKQGLLISDFGEVPLSIAKLINAGAYNKVSAEIYNRPPEGVPFVGKALRRVVILGGELPHIKTLQDLPWADYAEFKDGNVVVGHPGTLWPTEECKFLDGGITVVFSEVKPMDRNAMINALLKSGSFKTDFFEKLTDDQVKMAFSIFTELDSKASTATMKFSALEGAFEEFKEAHGVGIDGEDTDEFWKKKGMTAYMEHCGSSMKKHGQSMKRRGKKMFGEDYEKAEEDEDKKKSARAEGREEGKDKKMSEKELEDVVTKVISKFTATTTEELKAAQADIAKFKESTKRESVTAFVESRRNQGKISAAELDKPNGRPNLIDRLMSTDGTAVVYTFAEGSRKVDKTALDLAMDEIDSRPSIRNPEKVGSGKDGGKNDTNRKEWAEDVFSKFSESMDKSGITKANFIASAEKASDQTFAYMQKEWKDLESAGVR